MDNFSDPPDDNFPDDDSAFDSAVDSAVDSVVDPILPPALTTGDAGSPPIEPDRILKELWEGKPKCRCCTNWVDEPPANLRNRPPSPPPPARPNPRHSLVVRRLVSADGSGPQPDSQLNAGGHNGNGVDGGGSGSPARHASVYSINVNNVAARAVLADVFSGFETIITDLPILSFRAPFHQFFYRWDRFEQAVADEKDGEVKGILDLLRKIVRAELTDAFTHGKGLLDHGVISWRFLWTLFTPGDIICSARDGYERFFFLRSVRITPCFLYLSTVYVDWDGRKLGTNQCVFTLSSFENTRPIRSLKAFPAKYLPNFAEVQARLIERGKKFVSLAGVHYKCYRPLPEGRGPNGDGTTKTRRLVEKRIMIDHDRAVDAPGNLVPLRPEESMRMATGLISQAPVDVPPAGGHRPLLDPAFPGVPPTGVPRPPPGPPLRVGGRRSDDTVSSVGSILPVRRPIGGRRRPSFGSASSDSDSESEDERGGEKAGAGKKDTIVSDFHLQLCNSHVHGLSFRDKKWRKFEVDRVLDVEWNAAPFDSLVLPNGYKDLILSFVESQLKDRDAFDDVINGKGGGLVILLAGEPGVGKTLTAESVAEKIKAPLYKLDLGEADDTNAVKIRRRRSRSSGSDGDSSGYSSDSFADGIETAFKLAARWGAVLLIDECDMYLQKRGSHSSQRNKIVCRFLQLLEYYPSLLFLTTNRERELDSAVHSRIHLTINYPSLNPESRRRIWATFLARDVDNLPPAAITLTQMDALCAVDVNGRRIRNVVRTALIVARRAGRGITYADVRNVMRVTEALDLPEIQGDGL